MASYNGTHKRTHAKHSPVNVCNTLYITIISMHIHIHEKSRHNKFRNVTCMIEICSLNVQKVMFCTSTC